MILDNDIAESSTHAHEVRGEPLALTAAQRDIWYSLSLSSNGGNLNIADYREIHAAIDPLRIHEAMRAIIRETDTLRLCFGEGTEQPFQHVGPMPDKVLQFFDVSQSDCPREVALQWMQADVARAVNIFADPLAKYALFQLAPNHFFWYQRYHHLIMDGIGGALIARRLAQRYSTGPLAKDYIGSVEELLRSDEQYRKSKHFEEDRTYWMRQMVGRPQAASLSGRAPLHSVGILRSSSVLVSMCLTDALSRIAVRTDSSFAQLCNAATVVFLHRMTGSEDLLVGQSVGARVGQALRQIPGMASNTIPLRVNVSPDDSFAQVLQQAKRLMRKGLRHQRYRQGDLRRDLGLHPVNDFLFATVVNFMPFDQELRFEDGICSAHNLSTGPVDDLSISFYEQAPGQGLKFCFSANAALYTMEQLSQHQQRFLRLLEMLVNHDGAIGQIDLVTSNERKLLLSQWSNNPHPLSATSFLQLFATQAQATPSAIALCFEGTVTSYSELVCQSGQLASELKRRAIVPGSVVGVALERGPLLVTALLAVLRVGAAYLPLDPHHPAQRLDYIVRDAQADLILCESRTSRLMPSGADVLLLDHPQTTAELAQHDHALAFRIPCAEELAYLIYTSGSTGQPKGVAVTHGGLANFLLAMQSELALTEHDRLLAVTTISFDIAGLELFLPLCCGASVELVSRSTSLDGQLLGELCERCSLMQATPATWRMMLASGWKPRPGFGVLVGGEAVPGELAKTLLAHDAQVRVMYGPTETTIWSSCARLSPQSWRPAIESIGRPIWNTALYILDAKLRLVPPGMAGELCIAGDGLARGYVRRSGQTAERFVADPYGAHGARMYRTGDLARHSADGSLEFLGRIDQQVKIRGFRIELGEIEAVLGACRDVQAVAVHVHDSSSKGAQLVAYIVGVASTSDLRVALRERLPDYMVPSVFLFLQRLPLTPNGKIDRRQLPAPTSENSEGQRL